jgi:hypothetical protein
MKQLERRKTMSNIFGMTNRAARRSYRYTRKARRSMAARIAAGIAGVCVVGLVAATCPTYAAQVTPGMAQAVKGMSYKAARDYVAESYAEAYGTAADGQDVHAERAKDGALVTVYRDAKTGACVSVWKKNGGWHVKFER